MDSIVTAVITVSQ